jgi:hypothetical protein
MPNRNCSLILEDIDFDGKEELILPMGIGYGSNFTVYIYKIENQSLIGLGSIEGLQTKMDSDHDGRIEFAGRTITDTAYLSETDKTYYSYVLEGKSIIKEGYIHSGQVAIIEAQLEEAFRLFPDIGKFNDLLVFKIVHNPSLTDIIIWYDSTKPYICSLYSGDKKSLSFIDDMEREFIDPVRLLLDGKRTPEALAIYNYRVVKDYP